MPIRIKPHYPKLFLFCVGISLITYGFNLTNFFISIDNELPVIEESSMPLGRWGTNLFLYRIFGGIIPYYTLLLSLIFMAASATGMAKLFKLNGYGAYIFCALMLSFPQLAYQFVFGMQANAIGAGFLSATLAIFAFKSAMKEKRIYIAIPYFIVAALLVMFTTACYQALIVIPVVIYAGILYTNTYNEDYTFKAEIKPSLLFGAMLALGVVFYYLSVKILCSGSQSDGFMQGYAQGDSGSRIIDFYNLWIDNLRGNTFYGSKSFVAASILSVILLVITAIKNRSKLIVRAAFMVLLLLIPFFISFFILNGSHPPRLYVTAGISFALILALAASEINFNKLSLTIAGFIVLANIYFVTALFVSQNKIYQHDLTLARRINDKMYLVNPDFDEHSNRVYFYGKTDDSNYNNFRLPNSEIFGGSIFQWDGGNNYRICSFNQICDVATYIIADDKENLKAVQDSVKSMPIWPKAGSIKLVKNVMVVKLGTEKGANLWIE